MRSLFIIPPRAKLEKAKIRSAFRSGSEGPGASFRDASSESDSCMLQEQRRIPLVDRMMSDGQESAVAADGTGQACVLVCDRRDLRRAGLVAHLSPWAASLDLLVVAAPDVDCIDLEGLRGHLRAVILSDGTGCSSGDFCGELRAVTSALADVPAVVVSDHDAPEQVLQCVRAGAAAFLPTSASPDFALRTIAFVVAGGSYFPIGSIRAMAETTRMEISADIGGDDNGHSNSEIPNAIGQIDRRGEDCGDDLGKATLTSRERQVLDLLMHGETNKVIGRRLGTTEGTIKIHVRQIMRKLGAANRTQAALTARGIGSATKIDDERPSAREPG